MQRNFVPSGLFREAWKCLVFARPLWPASWISTLHKRVQHCWQTCIDARSLIIDARRVSVERSRSKLCKQSFKKKISNMTSSNCIRHAHPCYCNVTMYMSSYPSFSTYTGFCSLKGVLNRLVT
jgi:hypothetical protein